MLSRRKRDAGRARGMRCLENKGYANLAVRVNELCRNKS
jgi:hypothetical protein